MPRRPDIPNCSTPTEVLGFLEYRLKPIMQNGLSYIGVTKCFEKVTIIRGVPDNSILDTAGIVGLCSNIPLQTGSKAFKKVIEK